MPLPRLVHVVELIHRRRARLAAREKSKSQRALQLGGILLTVFSVAAALAAPAALPAYAYITYELPPVEQLEVLLNAETGLLLQPTRFYDRTGETVLLTLEPPEGQRRFIDVSGNQWLATAFVASSQPDFWEGPAVRWSLSAGPQTIAERLVARVLLAGESEGWIKNLRTRLLAAAANQRYGREQILEWALNTTSFGHWTFGAESAARFYFAKPAAALTLAEATMLAAAAQAPALNPVDAPELTVEFQRLVLVAMREQALISDEQFTSALSEQLTVRAEPSPLQSFSPEFTDFALAQLEAALGRERVQLGGLEVVTTLDVALQEELRSRIVSDGQIEALVLDPTNGQILAVAGNISQPHETGSIIAPFIYLNAFAQGKSPASLVWDLPSGSNFSASAFHGPVSMREALANSYAVPLANLSLDDGAEATLDAFGMNSQAAILLETAMAYGVLANQGTRAGQTSEDQMRAAALLFAGDLEGDVLLNWTNPELLAITSSELAFLVSDVLNVSSTRNEEINTRAPTAAFFGPAGTGWAIGYSPQRVIAVWGGDHTQVDENWSHIFQATHQDMSVQPFVIPAGLNSVVVCTQSGSLPDETCAETRREYFISGNEPQTSDTFFERLAINTLNDLLATVFTPQEFVEERLFMRIPAEAEGWAQAAGIPLLPTEFDPVPAFDSTNGTIALTNPRPFSAVSGTVSIFGRMSPEAVSYDVQVGNGLYPTEWTLIDEGEARNGSLARWDTLGLSGVYAIQLQVIDAEGNLTRVFTVVTVSE